MSIPSCTIKIFGGGGVMTSSNPPSPYDQLLSLPTPVLRCFWKDPLTTPPLPTTPIRASFTATPSPSTTPSPIKILIILLLPDEIKRVTVAVVVKRYLLMFHTYKNKYKDKISNYK